MLVVTNGPVAIAGSISSFLSINGIIVPTVAAITIDAQILSPTTNPKLSNALVKVNFAKTPSSIP